MKPTIEMIQREITQALNKAMPLDWSAFRATDRNGTELVEICPNGEAAQFIIVIEAVR